MKIKKLSSLAGVFLFFFFSSHCLQAAISEKTKYKRKRLIADPYLSTRALGRGNTYITTSTDQDAILLNPANIPQAENIYYRTYLFSLSAVGSLSIFNTFKDINKFMNAVQGGTSGKNILSASETFKDVFEFVEKWEKDAVSAHTSIFLGTTFKYVSFGVLGSGTVDLDSGLETVEDTKKSMRINLLVNVGPYLAFTLPIPSFEELTVGFTAKYLVRGQVNLNMRTDLAAILRMQKNPPGGKDLLAWDYKPGFDLGITYKPKLYLNPRFGILFSNIGNLNFASRLKDTDYTMEPIRQNLGIGASIHPELGPGVLSASLDIRDITASYDSSFLSEIYIGVDYLMWEMLGLSTGLSQGYPTGALYFTSRFAQIDLGIYTRERELRVGQKPETSIFLKLALSI